MTPTPEDLRAYREGRLELARFEEVDRWLAAQPAEEQSRILTGDNQDDTEVMAVLSMPASVTHADEGAGPFTTEATGQRRYRMLERIGAGGMGIVEAAHDEVLGREVALKRCRPRRVSESLATHAARLRAFKREAAITAQLEHPGIVPVHDVGVGPNGEPAFTMKRLDGEALSALIARRRREGQRLDLAHVAEVMLRVAEAVAHAHRRHIAHRDLKPDNVIVGALGAVYVIDWGLATHTLGTGSSTTAIGRREADDELRSFAPALLDHTTGTYRLGTPAWMAPEQFGATPANPRMDVFALGGLLMALLTGYGPREVALPEGIPGAAVNLAPLNKRGLPSGLVAVARRCLAADPAERYKDGSAVADELRRWLSAGLTLAEQPTWWTRLVAGFRHSPRTVAAVLGAVVALGIGVGVQAVQHAKKQQKAVLAVHALATEVDFNDEDSLRDARADLAYIAKDLPDLPDLPEARVLDARIRTAIDLITAQQTLRQHRDLLRALHKKYRIKGPWPGEIAELHAALVQVGYGLDPARPTTANDAARLHADDLCTEVLTTLVQLQRAYLIDDEATPLREIIPKLIADAGPTAGWRALGTVLARTTVNEHDLVFAYGPEAEAALNEGITADLLLATFGPEPRLVKVAWERWHEDTAAFWPRIMGGRECLDQGDWRTAERHALVALGAEPDSLWPHLILAYVALADNDAGNLLREADAGLLENPGHFELTVLKAVALARTGKRDLAQALIAASGQAGHLQHHLHHHTQHPMERSIAALIAAGVTIPNVPPTNGPLVRPPAPAHPH